MLSFTYTGAFEFDAGIDRTALLGHLAGCLRKINAREVKMNGFRSG